jgi:hypothetical protein
MLRVPASVLCALMLLALTSSPASATFSNYAFTVSTGSAISPTFTDLVSGQSGRRTSSGYYNTVFGVNLPFTFVLDGASYSRLSVSTNGLISLGNGNAATTGSNSLISTSSTQGQYPRIAAWWDQLYVTGGATRYCSGKSPTIRTGVSGSSPNRIFVVDFRDIEVSGYTAAFSSWQVRFYEGSNAIEFYYGNMTSTSCKYTTSTYSTSATIGIADASSDYISITPNGATATKSNTSVFNSVNLANTTHRIPAGTIYRIAPCNVSLTGNVAQGGTATMASGDTLLRSMTVQRGNTSAYLPLSIDNSTAGCGPRGYSLAISGPAAGDYTLSTTSGTLNNGESVMPMITFTPNGFGVRNATLNVADNNGFFRSYTLAAIATTRIGWTGDIAQGGTATLASGDSLMKNSLVLRYGTGSFTPITVQNINANVAAAPATVTLSIDSAGAVSTQYSIVGASSASLSAGQTFTPVIRFDPTGVGPQNARLVVNADGEIRTYPLIATSMAPMIHVNSAGAPVGPTSTLLSNYNACVGDVLTTMPLTVTNNGALPLIVNDIDFYMTDTTYQQGTPQLPLVRTSNGGLVPLRDYLLSEVPGIVPISATPALPIPFTVEPYETKTLYLTFVGQEPGKRFARMFLRTNAQNIVGIDTNLSNTTTPPVSTEGLFVTELLGRSVGSQLVIDGAGLRLKPVVFPATRVGDTSTASFTIGNTGVCDLRIARGRFRVSSGDVNEIKLLGSFRNAVFDATTGDYILAAGQVDTVTVQFTPSRSGTRMATLMVQTNDSTIARPGLSERGAYYLDLSGRGLAGLETRELVLNPVAIGSWVNGVAVLENSLNIGVTVSSISFDGDDAAEFSENDQMPWPARPHTVLPGEKLNLGVRLTPAAGSLPGTRRTTMILVTSSGDSVRVPVRGEAGTLTLTVSPSSLFDNVIVPIGQSHRQTLMIANNGTLPTRIATIGVTGPDSASYRIGKLPRMDLDAGQTEFVEVTFAPTASGQSSATIELTTSNGQTYSVLLGGEGLRARRDIDVSPTLTAPVDHGDVSLRIDETKRPTLR